MKVFIQSVLKFLKRYSRQIAFYTILFVLLFILSSSIVVMISVGVDSFLYPKTFEIVQSSAENKIYEILSETYREGVVVNVDGIVYQIPRAEILKDVQVSPQVSLFTLLHQVFSSEIKLSSSQYSLDINDQAVVVRLPFYSSSMRQVLGVMNSSPVNICDNHLAKIPISYEKLDAEVLEAMKNRSIINLHLKEILQNPEDYQILQMCNDYEVQKQNLSEFIDQFSSGVKVNDVFDVTFLVESRKIEWEISNARLLEELLKDYARIHNISKEEGKYIVRDNTIYLLSPFRVGRTLEIEETIKKLKLWLDNDTQGKFQLQWRNEDPVVKSVGLPIKNFTKLVGAGRTRLSLLRDGHINYAIAPAEGPLLEINNTLIGSGEEFSFIETIGRHGNMTESGFSVGSGSCNATTTLFRMALESGFPITERWQHGFYVASYKWPYEYNLVDAAYYPSPPKDFKFRNDLKYPILIHIEISRDDKFQYHTAYAYTDPRSQDRTVKLGNWQIQKLVAEHKFIGSFDREVSVNGVVVRRDSFVTENLGSPILEQ